MRSLSPQSPSAPPVWVPDRFDAPLRRLSLACLLACLLTHSLGVSERLLQKRGELQLHSHQRPPRRVHSRGYCTTTAATAIPHPPPHPTLTHKANGHVTLRRGLLPLLLLPR